MKKALKITGIILGVILLLLCGAMVALQTESVQKKVLDKVIEKMGGHFDGDISVGSISLLPFSTVIVRDALVTDREPFIWDRDSLATRVDTFAYVGYAAVKLSLKSIFRGEGVVMQRAIVRHAEFNLTIEPNLDTTIDRPGMTNLQRIFNLEEKKQRKKEEPGKIFEIKNVEVENFIFRMKNYQQKEKQFREGRVSPYQGGIDWDDMELITDVKGRNLGMEGFLMHGTADHVEIFEKSGILIDHVEGHTVVGKGKTYIGDIHIRDANSDIDVPRLEFIYGDQAHFNDFVHGVRIVADVNPSRVDLGRTIGYFAPALLGNPTVLDVARGGVDGPVCALGLRDIQFKDLTSGVSGAVSGTLSGLPDNELNLDADISPFRFTTASLGTFIKSWAPRAKIDLRKFAPGETFTVDVKGKGPLSRLVLNGKVRSNASGSANFRNLLLENLTDKKRDIAIGGALSTDRLNIGKIAGIDKIGTLTMESSVKAVLGKKPLVTIDSLLIRNLQAMGYDYSNIRAQGVYSGDEFDGRIVSHDPNLDLMAQGIFSTSRKSGNAGYEFFVNLGYADLGALGFDPKGKLKVALNADASFIKAVSGDLVGDVTVSDVTLTNDSGTFDIGDITVQSHINDEVNRMKFISKFFDGTYVSTEPITSFIKQMTYLTAQELPSLFTDKRTPEEYPADYDLSFKFFDTGKLLEFVLPSAYIENGSSLDVRLTRDNDLTAKLRSGRLAIGNKYLKGVSIDLDNREKSLNATLSSSELSLGGIKLLGANAVLYADDEIIGADIRYDNKTEKENKADVSLAAEFRRDAAGKLEIGAHVLPSSIHYDGDLWRLTSDEILVKDSGVSIDRFQAASTEQFILVDGGISPTKTDTLSVRLEKFDISLLDNIVRGGFTFKGKATGHALITSPVKDKPGLLASLQCHGTEVAGYPVGTLFLDSSWNDPLKRFDIDVHSDLDGRAGIDAEGWISDKGKLDVTAQLNQFNLGYIQPILASVFSTFDGGVSGKVRASGEFKDLHISSEDTRVDDAHLTLAYTKVPYTVNGPVSISEKGIIFLDTDITDTTGGTGKARGGVYFNTLKNISLGLDLSVNDMLVLNTSEGDDPSFYGKLKANGTVSVTGPVSNIGIDVNAQTAGPGEIHIPLGNASGEKRNFLTFYEADEEEETDPYEVMMSKKKKAETQKSDLNVHLHVNAMPEVTAYIEVNKVTGNILSAHGNGDLDIVYTSKNNYFGINGNYNITGGKYVLNALNVINKEFTVRDGSTVRFNGDIMDTDLDIDGLYVTKASLSQLLSEAITIDMRRTVECGIKITDKLRNPEIGLSINVPDLEPTVQSMVESALNTEDKVQKQFIYLLLTGSFMPNDLSGIVNNSSNMLYSNVTNIMTNQLNNIFAQLDIPLDLGLNYKSTESGNDIFDVAVSTELFNNRVIVNGTIGNREYSTTGKTSVVGNVDIEIKLDRQGNIRLNLFSHAADDYSNFLDTSQRNGGGIAYQREFNTFRQFFRTLFMSRKKRQEEYIRESRKSKTVTVEIDENGKAKP